MAHRNPHTLARRTNGNHRQRNNRPAPPPPPSAAPPPPMAQNLHNPPRTARMSTGGPAHPRNQRKAAPPKKRRQSHVDQEIRDLQASTHPILPKSRFRSLVKEMLQDYMTPMQIEKEALTALQSAAEEHLVKMFSRTNKITARAGRVTIKKEDMQLVRELLEE